MIFQFYRQTVKKDKGAAMTLVFKILAQEHSLIKSDKSLFLAADNDTKKILVHQKCKSKSKESTITLPTVSIPYYMYSYYDNIIVQLLLFI